MNICTHIKQLKPYQAGKPTSDLARELGLENIVKLASNERPKPISSNIEQAIIRQLREVNRYPDNNGFALKVALSKHLSNDKIQVNNEQLILGNGSSNILELAAKSCLCQATDEVVFSEYAFMLYGLITQSLGVKAVVVPSKNYGHDLTAMLATITDKTRLIFIANPNNPSGTFLRDADILAFLQQVPNTIMVVLDEAYVEYVSNYQTLHFLNKFPNLLITRTFSKAYGLAGLRVGYGIANPELIDYLNRIRAPFNVNTLAEVAAVAALKDQMSLLETIALNTKGMAQFTQAFAAMSLESIPSNANFISVKTGNTNKVYNDLLALGFIVRPIEIPEFIRISIGTKNENDGVIAALKQVLKND